MAEIDRPRRAPLDIDHDADAGLRPRWGRLWFVIIVGSLVGCVPSLFEAASLLFWVVVLVLVVGFAGLVFVRWTLGLSVIQWVWNGLRLPRDSANIVDDPDQGEQR